MPSSPQPDARRSRLALSRNVLDLEEELRGADEAMAERLYERWLRMRRILAKLDNQLRLHEALQDSAAG